jgi:hypothetical protein
MIFACHNYETIRKQQIRFGTYAASIASSDFPKENCLKQRSYLNYNEHTLIVTNYKLDIHI